MPDDQQYFKEAYAQGNTPWDSGNACSELLRILDQGAFPAPPQTLLELGCGTGTNAVELARRGYRVTANDYVEEAVVAARDKAKAAQVEIDFISGDACAAPLKGPFDLIFDRGVYHHIRTVDLPAFLDMMKNVTRPGTLWFCLAGNANEQTEFGPPRVHEKEFRAELGDLFEMIEVKESRLITDQDSFRPLFWSILMKRKADTP